MNETKPLADRVAWVTGSSRGLGRVMATELCRQGATVVVHGTRQDSPRAFGEGDSMEQVASDIAREASGNTAAVWGDVTDDSDVRRMAGEIRQRLGRIDILVTNAGGDIGAGGTGVGRGGRPDPDDAVRIPTADIRAVLDRNLLSCILCCREVAREMTARRAAGSSRSAPLPARTAASTARSTRSPRPACTSTHAAWHSSSGRTM